MRPSRSFAWSAAAAALLACGVANAKGPPAYVDVDVYSGDYAPAPGLAAFTTPWNTQVYLRRDWTIPGDDIVSVTPDTSDGQAALDIEVSASAGERMEAFTAGNVGKVIGIFVDGRMLSVSNIRGAFSNRFRLSGVSERDVEAMQTALIRAPATPPAEATDAAPDAD